MLQSSQLEKAIREELGYYVQNNLIKISQISYLVDQTLTMLISDLICGGVTSVSQSVENVVHQQVNQ